MLFMKRVQLEGYTVEMDIRDPGTFVLQLAVHWYFGATEPTALPLPISVGGHMDNTYREANMRRSLVHNGETVLVTLRDADLRVTRSVPRFATFSRKCTTGDAAGRWLNQFEFPCEIPFCTGERASTVNTVRLLAMIAVV